jgi:serine/threonine protein kinase
MQTQPDPQTPQFTGSAEDVLQALGDVPAELVNHPKFRIVKKLGNGGMGTVYLAEHQITKRQVALKVINQAILRLPNALPRFLAEAQAASRLTHPNIVAVLDADRAGDLHFLVMEYVAGVNLADYLHTHGPLPIELACRVAAQAAEGLQHAHEKGLVHRDIKPANLMLAGEPGALSSATGERVKILDFGLVRVPIHLGGSGLTQDGGGLGTPEYMAPEQSRSASKADIRADIYSLGCTLYCLLTGEPPFLGTMAMVLREVRDPEPVRQRRPEVPEALSAVVDRMLARDPEHRYRTPAEVARELTPFGRNVAPQPQLERGKQGPITRKGRSPETVLKQPVPEARKRSGREPTTQDRAGREASREREPSPGRGGKTRSAKKPDNTLMYVLIGGSLAGVVLGVVLLGLLVLFSSGRTARQFVQKTSEKQGIDRRALKPGDPIFAAVAAAVNAGKTRRTRQIGPGVIPFEETPPGGALLVGLEVGKTKWQTQDVIATVRPIFLTPTGRVLGTTQGRGAGTTEVVTLDARPGFAVGDITVKAGGGFDGLSVTFMAVEGAKLNPAISYTSEWVGGQGGRPPTSAGGDGSPVVGLHGKLDATGNGTHGLGLVLASGRGPE